MFLLTIQKFGFRLKTSPWFPASAAFDDSKIARMIKSVSPQKGHVECESPDHNQQWPSVTVHGATMSHWALIKNTFQQKGK